MFAKTHISFKKMTVERDLSMQEIFEHLAQLMSEGHPALAKILDDYAKMKKNRLVEKLEEKYTENLYDVIGEISVASDEK